MGVLFFKGCGGGNVKSGSLKRFPPPAGGTKQRFPLRSRGNLTEGVFKKCRAMSLDKGERAESGGIRHAQKLANFSRPIGIITPAAASGRANG
jgi:hypothetical protein